MRTFRFAAALAWAATAAALSAQPAPPDRAPPDGRDHPRFIVGLDPITYAQLRSDAITGGRTVGGTGAALRFGWAFTPRVALLLDVAITDLVVADTAAYELAHADLLLRYTPVLFQTRRGTIAPQLHAGWGLRDVTADGIGPTGTRIYTFEGGVLTLAAGAEWMANPRLAFRGLVAWSVGEFDDERSGNITVHNRNEVGESLRIGLGLTLYAVGTKR